MFFHRRDGLSWWVFMWISLGTTVPAGNANDDPLEPVSNQNQSHLKRLKTLTLDHEKIDFDAFSPGRITVDKVLKSYPNSGINHIEAIAAKAHGLYDYRFDNGHGLGTDPSGQGLMVHTVGERLRQVEQVAVTLSGKSTQFGFGIGAWHGAVSVQVFAGSRLLSSLTMTPAKEDASDGNGKEYFFESDVPFDRVLISAKNEENGPTWILTFIASQRRFTVPTLSPLGIAILITGLLAMGMVINRRQRMPIRR